MLFMRLSSLLLCLVCSAAVGFAAYKVLHKPNINNNTFVPKKAKHSIAPASIKAYAKKNNFNTSHCFLIDMTIPSNQQRFFVYNLQTDSVEMAGLVCHGSGKKSSNEIIFSNEPNSLCSSIGKYKVGLSYNGKFGLAFKLHGLDATNSNAYARAVVLHAHSCVPNAEVEYPICQSWGCPTVSPAFLQALQQYIKASPKPILLNIAN